MKSIRKSYFIKFFNFLFHPSTGIGIGRGGRRVQGLAAEGGIELRNKQMAKKT
jgi:hypothetical protein